MNLIERGIQHEKGTESKFFMSVLGYATDYLCEEQFAIMALTLDKAEKHMVIEEFHVESYVKAVQNVQRLMPSGTLRSKQVLATICWQVVFGGMV